MPKIFLIKNRLLQQQQRLLETSKHSSPQSLDDVDSIESANEKLSSPSIQQQLQQLQQPLSLKLPNGIFNGLDKQKEPEKASSLIKSGPSSASASSEDEEPLSLVVHKG